MTVDARLSLNGKYVVCGGCGRSLCRRERIVPGPPVFEGQPAPPRYIHALAWDTDWQLVDGCFERSPGALDRLATGNTPTRRPRGSPMRPEMPRHKGLGTDLWRGTPVRCPWAICGALNRFDRKRLDVAG